MWCSPKIWVNNDAISLDNIISKDLLLPLTAKQVDLVLSHWRDSEYAADKNDNKQTKCYWLASSYILDLLTSRAKLLFLHFQI